MMGTTSLLIKSDDVSSDVNKLGHPSKVCFKCEILKPLDEFYKHPAMLDGRLNKCKTCNKKDVHDHRHNSESREKILAYDRARGNRQDPSYLKDYRERFPMKYRAHTMVNNAIRDGKLVSQPCEECGKKAVAHHDDYSLPLIVRWLCQEHHLQWHAKNGEGLNYDTMIH